jgi:prepilin-type N-terminal cleavage/methylation domain-containing protein
MPPTNNPQLKTEKAFTLIELLVVIAIVGILAGLAVVNMSGATEAARIAKLKVYSNSIRSSLMGNRVSEWRFDEGEGTSTADTVGYNGGILTNGPIWKSGADCIDGGCLQFDGTNDYVDCGSGPSLDITESLTISAWVFREGSQTYPMMVVKGDSHLGANYQFYLYSPTYKMGFWFGSSPTDWTTVTSNSGLEANNWHYVTIVYVPNKVQFYLDGVKDGEKAISGTPVANATSLFIGTRSGANPFPWRGKIDEVRIYDSALTASDIRDQYVAGLDKLLASGQVTDQNYQQRIAELSSIYATNK